MKTGFSARLRGAVVLAATAALALTGCASTASDSTDAGATTDTAAGGASDVSFPLTFENADGTTTEIPEQPENIVSTSVTLTGALLSFDAPISASSSAGNGQFFDQWADVAEEKGIENLWAVGSVDVDALIAADPDLIVVSSSGADSAMDNLADFQAIAPTIVLDYGEGTWQDLTLELGEATGLSDEAQATIDTFESHVATVKEQITIPEGEANIISFNGPGEDNPIGKAGGPHAQLLTELGFTIEDPIQEWHNQEGERNDFVWASYENLTNLTADTTFILARDNEGAQAFAEDTVLANLPSVQNGQVYGLGQNSFRIDYYSATEIVDGIQANFGE
ncbi:Fe2+-enterobactin ABC transporter substrate-binding protein [Gulosibacter chungangensis]|uniref:Fe2+-enterobactin ABC transporter substrate-binding protein n=1 Tax=Gulosibacter chungangensis TaxID=979746 RepID=A0A7J5BBS2_9MICO|nr:Fe2+-enterobactin ABC transporter substrate-binding protein [Gulosibacter chungangensis]KAB1643210.1 Fe2+-enterobactin ABC transporter substrate-binding protein [Gulosibacter chungangensis]